MLIGFVDYHFMGKSLNIEFIAVKIIGIESFMKRQFMSRKAHADDEDNRLDVCVFLQGIKVLVVVVVVYAVLWLPMNVFQLCFNLLCHSNPNDRNFCTDGMLLQLLYISSHFLTVSNTAINPIIYGFANNRFRVCFRPTFVSLIFS